VTFDPFRDFTERGYLRNVGGEKDPKKVKWLEHVSFASELPVALDLLAERGHVGYQDVLDVHGTLFGSVYPWAGQDRLQTAPDLAVGRGPVLFAAPSEIRRSVDYALELAQKRNAMGDQPGTVMGYLAYGHPFLDGNGRALMTVHAHLAQRAGVSIAWGATNKSDYLNALTRELQEPGSGHLDDYLRPHMGVAIGQDNLASHLLSLPGLGSTEERLPEHEVAGDLNDADVRARYEEYELKREESLDRNKSRGR